MGPCPGGPKGPLAPLGPWDLGPFLGSWVPSPGSQGVSIRMALASTEREYLGACKYGACKRVGGHARSVKNQCIKKVAKRVPKQSYPSLSFDAVLGAKSIKNAIKKS